MAKKTKPPEESKISEENKVLKGVRNLLEQVSLSEEEFRSITVEGRKTGYSPAHDKLVAAIRRQWIESNGFGRSPIPFYDPPRGGIDFVGRVVRDGAIVLAVEVDRGERPTDSWRKLADIKAENKIWVHITKEERLERVVERVIKEISYFLKARRDVKEGEFSVFIKTPKQLIEKTVPSQ